MKQAGAPRDFPDDRLQFLFESVRLGTMRAASDYLGMAPSSISRQIAGLEKELGVEIVEKNRHRVQLTAAGERLIEYYRDRLAQRESLLTDLDNLKGMRTGHIRMATGKGLIRGLLAKTVADYAISFPSIRIDVTSMSSRAIIPMVRDDEVHFGIVMDAPSDPRVWSRAHFPEPYCFIVAPDHPLAGARSLDIRDLASYPLIVPEEGFRVRQLLSDFEVKQGLFLDIRMTGSSIQFIVDVTAAGSVGTIVPHGCVSDYVEIGRVVAIPISNAGLSDASVEIVTRVGRRLPMAAISLLEMLERNLRERISPQPVSAG